MNADHDTSGTYAPYAVMDELSRGRVHPEMMPSNEPPFELDRRRILNCTAFRRLMHKTQVFVSDQRGDHFRTRLTHTLEVVAQAHRIAAGLGLNVRLAGAIAMAHDLGHPPFGHAGEKALAELMSDHGGFEHNLQSLRVVDYLEHPYPPFRGLNLSFELREGLLKHHTRYDRPDAKMALLPVDDLLATGPNCTLEGQVANVADLIAYTLHDIEDGIGEDILDLETLAENEIWRQAAQPFVDAYGLSNPFAVRRPILHTLADRLVGDAVRESRRRIEQSGAVSPDDVRRHEEMLVGFSEELGAAVDALHGLLLRALYRHQRVVAMDTKAIRLIRELFAAYVDEPRLMPERYRHRVESQGVPRVATDYIAGMTDRFCQQEHQRLFAPFHFD